MKEYKLTISEETKDKIEQFLKLLNVDADIVEAENVKEPEEKEWPQDHNEYYFMFSDGDIGYEYFHAYSPSNDDRRLTFGNCFRTKEEAEFEAERLKVLAEMKKFAEPKDRKWDGINEHWGIWVNMTNKTIYYARVSHHKTNCIYFESREKAEKCVETIGEDQIMKFYARIGE